MSNNPTTKKQRATNRLQQASWLQWFERRPRGREIVYERGAIAIFLSLAIALLLLTVTVYATRLAISEVRQSSEIDRSNQAYFAAEAGIEEALRRLDSDPEASVETLFPEQNQAPHWSDQAVLMGDSDALVPLVVEPQSDDAIIGDLAWRNRRVYDSAMTPVGTQVKDETIQIDLSDLRQAAASGADCGPEEACDGQPLYPRFEGVEYCWTPLHGVPQFEWTVISWPQNNITDSDIRKALVSQSTFGYADMGHGNTITVSSSGGSYSACARFNIDDTSRRYIVRLKPLFDGVGDPASHDPYAVSYQVRLLSPTIPGGQLYVPNDSFLIDVVGQSGDIRRRVIAKKDRSSRLLGVFDFLLYSGDPNLPLCKFGVQQPSPGPAYNLNTCTVGSADNIITPTPLPEPPQTVPRTTVAYNYVGTGSSSFVVPDGVDSITIEAWGAQGGNMWAGTNRPCQTRDGGRGGYVEATYAVSPGQTLQIRVGGAGTAFSGGFNGGGPNRGGGGGSGGGGASDVRPFGTDLTSRMIVAGGGGGAGSCMYTSDGAVHGQGYNGGDGGANTGADGAAHSAWQTMARGGSLTAGGAAGTSSWWQDGLSGSFGIGGRGGGELGYCCAGQGGGGGGGFYGGGGGAAGWATSWSPSSRISGGGGGAGGSNFSGAGSDVTNQRGVRSGHGRVTITYGE